MRTIIARVKIRIIGYLSPPNVKTHLESQIVQAF